MNDNQDNILEPKLGDDGLPADRLSDGSIVMDGHDYENAYWIHPVIVSEIETEPGLSVTELDGELSIEGTFFEKYLLDTFCKHFHEKSGWNAKRFTRVFEDEGRYLDRFEFYLEDNFFTYEEMRTILCSLREISSTMQEKIPMVSNTIEEIIRKTNQMMETHPETDILSVVAP